MSRFSFYANDAVVTNMAAENRFPFSGLRIFLYYLLIREHILPHTFNLDALRMRLRLLSRIPLDISALDVVHNASV